MRTFLVPALAVLILAIGPSVPAAQPVSRYETREIHSRDGIGKFYLGREIAHVMGHQAAEWLERPEREQEERTSKLVELLGLKAGQMVADIGCGTGYITRPMARKVTPGGKAFGVDIQPEMLLILTNTARAEGLTNIVPVLGTITDPKLAPDSIDLAILVDVYHEFDHPFEMMAAIVRALKPGGRVVLVEFRGEDPQVPIKALHKMTEAQVKKEMNVHPLEWVETFRNLPWQHAVVFRKKPAQ